jgi:hypothetical protein
MLAQRNASTLACCCFLGGGAALTLTARQPTLAVYSLAYWHYYLYGLAYCYGCVPLAVFKRDAVLMKSASLGLLAWAYLREPLSAASLLIVVAGFGLNAAAANALGPDRTYYGYELADLPPRRVARFPYNYFAHPMLAGNLLAYGATLINAGFRSHWWPLACIHVAMNLGLLLMELYVRPRRSSARRLHAAQERHFHYAQPPCRTVEVRDAAPAVACATLGAGWCAWAQWQAADTALAACLGLSCAAYAFAIYRLYVPRITYRGESSTGGLR